jgi:protease I
MLEDKRLEDKKILMIVASRDFRDEEYFIPFEIFQKEGAEIVTASSVKGTIIGIEGGEARSSMELKEVEVKNFEAVIFIGGSGASEYFEDKEAHRIAQEAIKFNKVLGAICIAPVILARAGVLKDRKATVWSSISDKSGIEKLRGEGCSVSSERVVKDGKIVTADGPAVAGEFAKTVVEVLAERVK